MRSDTKITLNKVVEMFYTYNGQQEANGNKSCDIQGGGGLL